jgi:hypothetical protein
MLDDDVIELLNLLSLSLMTWADRFRFNSDCRNNRVELSAATLHGTYKLTSVGSNRPGFMAVMNESKAYAATGIASSVLDVAPF